MFRTPVRQRTLLIHPLGSWGSGSPIKDAFDKNANSVVVLLPQVRYRYETFFTIQNILEKNALVGTKIWSIVELSLLPYFDSIAFVVVLWLEESSGPFLRS